MTTRHPLFRYSRLARLSGIVLLCATTAIGCGVPQEPPLRPTGGSAPTKGTDILLLGTDGRSTITEKERRKFHAGGIPCNCADVMMLVHVSAKRDRVSVIGLPRDSLATIPAYRPTPSAKLRPAHAAKLNGAYAEGGAALVERTVEAVTGVSVEQYLQLDFRRFIDAVDQVGGVEVCTKRRLKDSKTKLNLAPGRHLLKGGQSLQYVRSRHVDTSADLGRIQRQQRFLVSALEQLTAQKVLGDPVAMGRVARTLLGPAKVQQGFGKDGVKALVSLASALSKVPVTRTEFATVPIAGFNPPKTGIGSTLRWDAKKAKAMFTKVGEDRPLIAAGSDPKPGDPPVFGKDVPVRGNRLGCP
ncbi:LCP family protein [Streptomyces sp. NPDC047042]|uniref:LCP family protein n=1 Tax=Streptomyces sp. NPDC047042 TaxID=3154807 RepID=UPI0033CA671E